MNLTRTFRNFNFCTILLFSALILMPVFAYADTLTVTTNKTTYAKGEVMKITAVYKKNDGTPITSPSTREVRIKDPAGVEKAKTSMTNAGNGVYSYNYTLPTSAPTGRWEVRGKFEYNDQEIKKYTYPSVTSTTADTTAPLTTASPAGGSFTSSVTVALTRNEAGTTYYTTNGTTPTTSSPVYSAPLTFTATTTLKYFSRDAAGNSEAVKTQTYTKSSVADTTAPLTTASPAGGSFTSSVTVALTRNEAGTTYYTTNGTTPSTSSPVYSAPLTFTATTTLKYFSRDAAGNSEAVKTQTYSKTVTSGTTHSTLTWTGYDMCRSCHAQQASDMFNSVHYQWRGASGMTTGPATQGKFSATVDNSTALNSYCINILGNWNNYSGCSNCHVGLGAKPSSISDAAQLDNIDCLICHQKDYKRTRPINGGTYAPNTALMTISMDQAVQTVSKPTRTTCLQCHAKGGGGDNFKRGDLAFAQGATTDAVFDVHMATTRGNLACQACHATASHKMAGRGSDLRPKESAAAVNCSTSSCHSTKASLTNGHTTSGVNHHIGRVSCQACHIKTYGKNAADTTATEATETYRSWRTSIWNAALNRYEPAITLANNLTPKYAFWNGTSWGSNLLDTPVVDPATGAYKISRPNGAISDPAGSKLYPFKYKTSEVPFNNGRNKLIAVDTSIFFNTGLVADAINQGMVNMGFSAGEAYTWVKTDEYQLITHEVAPAAGNVLACADCHKNTARMNLPAMGYALKAAKSIVCAQCHGDKSYSDYLWVHDKHVTSEGYDCSHCHNFSRASERGLKTTR